MTTCLCTLPPAPPPGCCDTPLPEPAVPVIPTNPPGLSRIRYRIGTFTSFRRAMLDDVARPDLLGSSPNPFARWHEGSDGDYHTMLIELWAYLADVLTFYQERIANEAYLPTATQCDSLRRLAELVGYRPGSGAGASVLLAFTVERKGRVTVPAGLRAGSRATPGRAAAVFETDSAVTALGEQSAIPMSSVAPINQFAKLTDYGVLFSDRAATNRAEIASHLYRSAGAAYLKTLPLQAAKDANA